MYGKFQIGNHTNHHIVIVHAALMVDIPDSKTKTYKNKIGKEN